jgi:hypothetical protein
MVSPNAGQTYLWADDEHLSAAGQQIEANYLHNLVQNAAPTVSETLTAAVDIVNNSTTNFAYQWQELAPGQTTWQNISGATNSAYVVQHVDVGSELRVQVTYIDSTGQTLTELSEPSAPVRAALNFKNDFDADGNSDLLLQNAPAAGTPDVMIDFLNGTSITSSNTISTPVGWHVEASADFNHDSKADIILQKMMGCRKSG